jgi:hypothetical protein
MRSLNVVIQLSAHFIVLSLLNHFFQVRPTEYLLWVLLIQVTLLNQDIKK